MVARRQSARTKSSTKRATARKATSSTRTSRSTRSTRTAAKTAKTAKSTKSTKKATKAPMQTTAIKNCWTKTQVFSNIAENTGLTKKQVSDVFCNLENIISCHMKKGGAGEFTMPGLAKFVTKRRPATKARKGINPFTGEEVMFKAKPARNVVKVRPLKRLKDMV